MPIKHIAESEQIESVIDDESKPSGGSVPFFEATASGYFQLYHEESPGGYTLRVRKQRVLELIESKGGTVLDVGCGPGVMAQELIDLGYEFWGVDGAPNMVEECRRNFKDAKNVHFCVNDATALKFSDDTFDLVLSMGVIDRIEKYEVAIEEMMRVLKKDGTLILALPNLFSPYAFWRAFAFYPIVHFLKSIYFFMARKPQPASPLASSVKLHSEKGATELLKKYLAEVTHIVYYNLNVCLSPLDEIFPKATVRVTKVLEKYRFGKLKWLGSGFIIKAKKVSAKVKMNSK